MRDSMYDDTAARTTLAPAVRTDGTVAGSAVDMAGAQNHFRVAMLVVAAGAITDGSHVVTLEHSADGATWTAVDAEHLQGAVPALGPAQAGTTHRVGYVGSRRYLRASMTTTGATVGGVVAAVVLMSGGNGSPIT